MEGDGYTVVEYFAARVDRTVGCLLGDDFEQSIFIFIRFVAFQPQCAIVASLPGDLQAVRRIHEDEFVFQGVGNVEIHYLD